MSLKTIGGVSAIVLGLVGATGAHAGTFTAASNTHPADDFVTEAFDFNLSQNVTLNSASTPQIMAVSTASSKGSYAYTGQSLGGAVVTCGEKTEIGTAPVAITPSTVAGDNGCAAGGGGGSGS